MDVPRGTSILFKPKKKDQMRKLLVCFSLVCSLMYAQEPILDQTRKHELGTSIQGLFGSGGGYGLTYRRMLPNSAFRFGLNLDGSNQGADQIFNTSAGNTNNEESTTRSISISTRLGYEGQIWLASNWMTYLGADILLGTSSSSSESTQMISGMETTRKNNNSSYSVGLAPFAGLRFQLSPRVSFGTELRYIASLSFLKAATLTKPDIKFSHEMTQPDWIHFFAELPAVYLQLAL
ncbi:MAG: hypothetical protein R3B47_11055 [Bacteroidia bacterium]